MQRFYAEQNRNKENAANKVVVNKNQEKEDKEDIWKVNGFQWFPRFALTLQTRKGLNIQGEST